MNKSVNSMKRYKIITYGCQMNKSDAERVAAVLKKNGYQSTESEGSADLIVVIACSVRQSAMDRVYGKAKKWQDLKNKKLKQLILTGCVLPVDRKKLAQNFDLIVSIDEFAKMFKLKDYFKINPCHESSFQAYVPIMTGCNNFCAYCVVPYVRGRERSRPVDDIIKEAKGLIKNGYKEITLLGQNVNAYCGKLKVQSQKLKVIDFATLLKLINDIPGDFWIRFVTSHPKDMLDELIEAVAKLDKVCEYIHLPVQAGDNGVLKKMNRQYTVSHYKNLIKKVRNKIPGVAITTDIIVGFPGETKKQFEQSVKLFKEIKFDMAYIAQYSPRTGTAAAKLVDDVSKQEKKRRAKILTDILKKTALENNKKLVGKILTILVEEKNRGVTRGFKNVKFENSDENLIGKFIKVKIIKVESWGLQGKLITYKNRSG